MKASRFSTDQIVPILHEAAAGGVVREPCQRHGMTEMTFYRGRCQYGDSMSMRQTPQST